MPNTAAMPNLKPGGFQSPVKPSMSARLFHTGGAPYTATATVGTDGWGGNNNTPVATETYFAEVLVTHTCLVRGIAVLNGSAAATDKYVAALLDVAGNVLANSAVAGITASGTSAYQALDFTAPIQLPPGPYYVALQANGTTTRFATHSKGKFGAGKQTSTVFGTLTGLVPPLTFTTNLGPIASLY
jgi:hypothetical protein